MSPVPSTAGAAIIPITNGSYMDLAWDDDGAIWAGGGNGTLLVSRDGGDSWENDPVGAVSPATSPAWCSTGSTPSCWGSGQPAALGGQRCVTAATPQPHLT